jgi:hypothetical protein
MEEPTGTTPVSSAAPPNCPDSAGALYGRWRYDGVQDWVIWAGKANKAYQHCCGSDYPVGPPNVPKASPEIDCHKVYEAFLNWAAEVRVWADSITTAVDMCWDEWSPQVSLPDLPDQSVNNCQEACSLIHKFHKELQAWGDDLRIPLDGCSPKPPPPPADGPGVGPPGAGGVPTAPGSPFGP